MLNSVHAQGKGTDSLGGGAPKGGQGNGATGKGKGTGMPAVAVQYPATILCPKLDQGKPCDDYAKPEGCPYMHPEDGWGVMR